MARNPGDRGFHIGPDGIHLGYRVSRPGLARFAFYAACILLALFVWQVQQRLFSAPYVETSTESLSPLQDKQLDAFLEMNRLLTTLGTTLLGALGFLISTGKRGLLRWRELVPAMTSAVFAGASIYFGYVAYQSILWMLESSFFDLDNPAIQWTRQAHFYSLLLAAFFFCDFVIHNLGKEPRDEQTQTASAT